MKHLLLLLLLPFLIRAQAPGSEESKKKAKVDLEAIRQRLLKGESFSSLAAAYSEDPGSSKNGGIYRGIKKGMMVEEFENVAFALKEGEVSEVFETQFGFHFIQLMSRKGEELELRHILVIPK